MNSQVPNLNPQTDHDEAPRKHHVCPWWIGYLIASPLRKLGENPEKIVGDMVNPGAVVVDIGSAMGFFSLPVAKMVGESGRVVCVDVQERMVSALAKRAKKKGLDRIIETRIATQENLGIDDLAGTADLVLAIHVVHETAYPRRFLDQCRNVLSPGGNLLLIEPTGHVSEEDFDETRHMALEAGFSENGPINLRRSRGLVLRVADTS